MHQKSKMKNFPQWGGGHLIPTPPLSAHLGASTHACGAGSLGASSFFGSLATALRTFMDE